MQFVMCSVMAGSRFSNICVLIFAKTGFCYHYEMHILAIYVFSALSILNKLTLIVWVPLVQH